MSISVLVYLGAVAVLWPACAFAVRRVAGEGLLDRLAAGLVTAMAWPVTVPLLAANGVRRAVTKPQPRRLELVHDSREARAYEALERIAVGGRG